MTRLRAVPAALAVTALICAALVTAALPPSPAHASGLPAQTQPDAVTVMIDSRAVHVDLGANDVDPEGDPVFYVGTDRNIPGVGILDTTGDDGRQDIAIFASTLPRPGDTSAVAPGVYRLTAYQSDGSNISAAALTITVLPSPGDAVEVVAKQPGRIRVRNDNDFAVRYYWGADGHKHPDGRADIAPHSSRTIRVERRSVVTVVLAGADYALGVERHLRPPRDGSAKPPGVSPTFGPFELPTVHWVRKLIRG